MFWLIFAFSVAKFIIGCLAYQSFKKAFNDQYAGQEMGFGGGMFGGGGAY